MKPPASDYDHLVVDLAYLLACHWIRRHPPAVSQAWTISETIPGTIPPFASPGGDKGGPCLGSGPPTSGGPKQRKDRP